MPASALLPEIAPSPPPLPLRRFTVEEYHRMGKAGVLTEDDRVELLEGWIVPKMVRKPPHDAALVLIDEAIRRVLPRGWHNRIQSAITTRDSEPEPDVAVVKGDARTFASHHPGPREIGLVIEVADASLAADREVKHRIYARAALRLYWIVNLVDGAVEVYSGPSGPGAAPAFRTQRTYGPRDSVPLSLGGRALKAVPVRDLLP
ncbi:MAG: Uma2 family endonuclease [Planctomycetes bacterium]|nr:Uma2 family endonuclease [Planctomycetota bacterium]